MEKLKVGILGATGMVGRHYISLLENHPWFEVGYVAASPRSAGKKYADAVAGKWHLKEPIPNVVKELVVHAVDEIEEAKRNCSFVFSAVDSDIAREWEEKYAEAGIPVISNASAHRNAKDVPMLIPEINPGHTEIIPVQRKNRGWGRGFIAVKPNCSIQCYMAPLYALHNDFKVRQVVVTTMQAISGAGHSSFDTIDMSETLKHKPFASAGGKQASVSEHAQEHAPGFSPGVLDIEDNIIPFISGEEEKSEREPLKIMGKIKGDEITCNDEFSVSAHCNRVPVTDGHMACVSVKFKKRPAKEQILEAWKNFRGVPQELKLPTAPEQPIIYTEEPDRPQTRYDRDNGKGMAVTIGRLRDCNVLDYRFVALSHNMIRGAAGGGILNAELLKAKGYLQ